MVGLTGTKDQIAQAAAAYNVKYEQVINPQGYYSMDHTSTLFLLAPDGSFVAQFDHHTDPARITGIIQRHIAEKGTL